MNMNKHYVEELLKGENIDVVVNGDIICYNRVGNGEFKGLWRVKSFMGNLYYDDDDMASMLVNSGIDDIL